MNKFIITIILWFVQSLTTGSRLFVLVTIMVSILSWPGGSASITGLS